MQPIFCDGHFVASSAREGFAAVDPSTGEPWPEKYPISPRDELAALATAGKRAAVALRGVAPARLGEFLERCAAEIEKDADAIAARAARETGLALRPRLREVEMARTLNQLRQAAACARDRSWAPLVVDAANDLRADYCALGGAVLVIGPSNFPLAFNGACGGDFASAIAAGNPVIAKAHPGHPGTTTAVMECVERALHQCPALPRALVQMFYQCAPADGLWLVAQPQIAAVGFTGSRASGLQIKEAADRAGKPAYLEMSSVNPVFVLPGGLVTRPGKVAEEFAGSCLLAAGQMCTSPGLVIVVASPAAEKLIADVAARLRAAPAGVLLGAGAPAQLEAAVATLCRAGATLVVGGKRAAGPGYRFENTLLRATGKQFLAAPLALQTEAFGSAALFVFASDADEMVAIAEALHGSLTGSVYSDDRGDEALYQRLAPILCEKVGRLLNDKMPTGVTVSPAMVHGGPFPATGHPGFTGVGFPAAIRRFAKLICFDHVRPHRSPKGV